MNHKTIALVGQPNSGKSTIFNVLSDIKNSSSQFAGTTVIINESLINVNGITYKIFDLPGTYSLNPVDKAEEVTSQFILNNPIDLIINVVDSTLLSRSLELTVEMIELGLPLVVALNMQDEAKRRSIKVNYDKLAEILEVPVVPTSALFGKGIKELIEKADFIIQDHSERQKKFDYTFHIEKSINSIEQEIIKYNNSSISSRFYAIKSIENPKIVPNHLYHKINELSTKAIEEIENLHKLDAFEAIAYERHHISMKLNHLVSDSREREIIPISDKLDRYLLHPLSGNILMLLFFILYFYTIFEVGTFIAGLIDGPIQMIPPYYESLKDIHPFLWFSVDGLYQGLTGAIGIVLPYFLPLLFLTAIFEDTRYMSRIAFLLDSLFHKIGLHGKSVVPFIMGFGCTVPAVYATRLLENRRDRLITGFLINFIPCSARITVIFALTAAFTSPIWAFFIFAFVIFIIAITGKMLSIFMTKPTGLVLDMPNLKLPDLKTTIRKTWINISEFLIVATPFLVAGSIFLGWLDYFGILNYLNFVFSPLVEYVLGLPQELGSTLVFGFLRKELIIVMARQALGVDEIAAIPLDHSQVVVFIIFVILYFPCVSTFAVYKKEFGNKVVVYSAILSLVIATVSAIIFKIGFNIFS